jgi:hypothetical protein
VLQETLADFEVCCCALQRLHQACRGVYSCVQAAAAARVEGSPDIWFSPSADNGGRVCTYSAENGDGVSVLCHVIADANCLNKRDYRYICLPPPSAPHLFLLFIFMQQVNSFFFVQAPHSTARVC